MRKVVFIILILLWSSAAVYVLAPEQKDERENRIRQAQRARIEKAFKPAYFWQDKT